MKKIVILTIAFLASATVWSQTLAVQTHAGVTWLYEASLFRDPSPLNAEGLTLDGRKYAIGEVDAMTVDNNTFSADYVRVAYADNKAWVYAPAAMADELTVRIDGANVDITVASDVEREITYVLTGVGCTFALHGDYKTTVVLDDVTLHAAGKTPAVWIDNGKRINIQVADNSVNTFCDAAANEKKSAFFVKGHAEWRGAGVVNLTGTSRHAYSSNEYTCFKTSFTGTFNVLGAASDALHVDQYLQMNGGTLNLSAMKGDGIDVAYLLDSDGTTPTSDEFNGEFLMNGGTINVVVDAADTKGVKCEGKMTITAGRINATAHGDGSRGISAGTDLYLGSSAAPASTAYLYLVATGGKYEYVDEAGNPDSSKCRGLKIKRDFYHYPSTVERGNDSSVSAKNLIDVDGAYHALGGILVNTYIE